MSARVTHSPDVAELGLRPFCAAGSGLPPRHKQRMEQTAGAATGLEKSSKLEHAKTELSGSYYAEEGGVMEQTGVKRANAAAAPDQQQKPAKRTRRERGSASKDRISKIPPPVAGKRSSVYRGVTRHRWTGRYEAHLWDKSTWNQNQNKKGKQVYLGAYDDEEAAARAYDLAALKYWGVGTIINFPVNDYARDVEEMQNVSREEYLASLRRKSSGFSRGVSKYRGVARHHHNGRWEARIGRVFGNKYLYLGTYGTQEEAAAAYDMAAIEYRGLNAVTNFDLSRYIKWLRPGQSNVQTPGETDDLTGGLHQIMEPTVECQLSPPEEQQLQQQQVHIWPRQETELEPYQFPSLGDSSSSLSMQSDHSGLEFEAAAPTALGLLWQSNVFKQMLEKASAHASCEEGMAMSGIFPSLEEEASRLPYEDEGLAADLTLPLPLPFTSFSHSSPGFSEAQEVWNSLANSLPMRSPISV